MNGQGVNIGNLLQCTCAEYVLYIIMLDALEKVLKEWKFNQPLWFYLIVYEVTDIAMSK